MAAGGSNWKKSGQCENKHEGWSWSTELPAKEKGGEERETLAAGGIVRWLRLKKLKRLGTLAVNAFQLQEEEGKLRLRRRRGECATCFGTYS